MALAPWQVFGSVDPEQPPPMTKEEKERERRRQEEEQRKIDDAERQRIWDESQRQGLDTSLNPPQPAPQPPLAPPPASAPSPGGTGEQLYGQVSQPTGFLGRIVKKTALRLGQQPQTAQFMSPDLPLAPPPNPNSQATVPGGVSISRNTDPGFAANIGGQAPSVTYTNANTGPGVGNSYQDYLSRYDAWWKGLNPTDRIRMSTAGFGKPMSENAWENIWNLQFEPGGSDDFWRVQGGIPDPRSAGSATGYGPGTGSAGPNQQPITPVPTTPGNQVVVGDDGNQYGPAPGGYTGPIYQMGPNQTFTPAQQGTMAPLAPGAGGGGGGQSSAVTNIAGIQALQQMASPGAVMAPPPFDPNKFAKSGSNNQLAQMLLGGGIMAPPQQPPQQLPASQLPPGLSTWNV